MQNSVRRREAWRLTKFCNYLHLRVKCKKRLCFLPLRFCNSPCLTHRGNAKNHVLLFSIAFIECREHCLLPRLIQVEKPVNGVEKIVFQQSTSVGHVIIWHHISFLMSSRKSISRKTYQV